MPLHIILCLIDIPTKMCEPIYSFFHSIMSRKNKKVKSMLIITSEWTPFVLKSGSIPFLQWLTKVYLLTPREKEIHSPKSSLIQTQEGTIYENSVSKMDAIIKFNEESDLHDEPVLEPPRKSYGSTATPIPAANLVALVPYLVNSCLLKLSRTNMPLGGGDGGNRPAKSQRTAVLVRDPNSSESETSESDESESDSATPEDEAESEDVSDVGEIEEVSESESDFIVQTGGIPVALQPLQETTGTRFQQDAEAEYERPEKSRPLMESYIINN